MRVPRFDLALGHVVGVDEHGDRAGCRKKLAHHRRPFASNSTAIDRNTSEVAAGLGETRDEADPNRIRADCKHGGDRLGCRLNGEGRRGASQCGDDGYRLANQIRGQRGKPTVVALRPAILEPYVSAFDITGLGQTLARKRRSIRALARMDGPPIIPINGRGCALATAGQAAALPSPTMNARRFIQ